MKQIMRTRRWLWLSLVTTALLAVQCGAPAPVAAPAGSTTAAPTQAAAPQAPTPTN